ncbi:MAG: bacterioferritin-associated ferredoxin [Bacteriovoracia bacterium]
MSDDDLICICMSVSRGEIRAAVKSGNDSLEGLKASLFCCTGCGTCEGRVRKVMEETQAEAQAPTLEKTGS